MSDWPVGVGRRVLAEVDSTNAEAARIATFLAGPEWILGLRQTQGRGRRGRPWADPVGNFAATLVMQPKEALEQVALRSFVAALALREALVSVAPTGMTALKWPNDVLLNGGKVAGILLESFARPDGGVHLAIGIGVNLSHAPQGVGGDFAPVSLAAETGVQVTPEQFLDLLAPAYARLEAQFVTYGFAPIRRAWLAHAARLGETVTARTMQTEVTGVFDTVDAAGNLVLRTDDGPKAIAAADVFF